MHIQDERQLWEFLKEHQVALTKGCLGDVVRSLTPYPQQTLAGRYLACVAEYDRQQNTPAKDWKTVYKSFRGLLAEAPLPQPLRFYVPNYCLLSGRNAGRARTDLDQFFMLALLAAQSTDVPMQDQLLGFVHYNYARLLLRDKEGATALEHFEEAGKARVAYYTAIAARHDADAVRAAATEVWKIRHEWATHFPKEDIAQCPITVELFNEVAPLANTSFSAKK